MKRPHLDGSDTLRSVTDHLLRPSEITIGKVEFGFRHDINGVHQSELLLIYFTDGSIMGIDTGSDRGFKVATLGTDTWNKNGHGWTDSANGGKFRGSLASQIEVLTKAARAGFQVVDLELQSAESLKAGVFNKLHSNAAIVLSFHDFRGTRKLDATFERMRALPADIYKVVSTATNLADNVAMMKFLERESDRHNVVGLCMGEQGIISRVLCVRAGGLFTFAAATPGEETAPGQVAARTLRDVYPIQQLDKATRAYGVAGDPVSESLSPLMMNAAFRREVVNAVYVPLHAKSLPDLLTCVREVPIQGLSVTMPYKEQIVEHLDNTDPLTAKIVVNRTPEKAQKLARQAHARYIKRADLKKSQFDVIINATAVGMSNPKDSPLAEDELNARLIFDMVYQRETRLLTMARAKGLHVITGEEMFVQQGARQFEIWTGKPAPVTEMHSVVRLAVYGVAATQPISPVPLKSVIPIKPAAP